MKTLVVMCVILLTLLCSMAGFAQQQSAIPQDNAAPPPATITGSGTANYIPRWTGSSTLGNSKLYQTGGKIGIATTTPSVQLDVNGRINAATSYRLAGVDVLIVPGGGAQTVGIGPGTLVNLSTGGDDTAVGYNALAAATVGGEDTRP